MRIINLWNRFVDIDLAVAYTRFQDLLANLLRMLPSLAVGAVVLVITLLLARGVKSIVQRTAIPRKHRNLALVLGRLSQWAVILLGLLVSVTIAFPSFTPANLISALGITGIAIGFAFRDIFENFLAGILILITEPFRINDQIVFGGYEGTVEEIETRATKIRTYDGRLVVIPNSALFKNAVLVNTGFDHRRMEYDFGIGYGDDIDLAKQVMLKTAQACEGVLAKPEPDVLTIGFAASSVTIRLRWWIQPPRRADALHIADIVLTAVRKALLREGIDLPFPTQHVLFHDQTEEWDGDRSRQREGWPAGQGPVPAQKRMVDVLQSMSTRKSPNQDRQT